MWQIFSTLEVEEAEEGILGAQQSFGMLGHGGGDLPFQREDQLVQTSHSIASLFIGFPTKKE